MILTRLRALDWPLVFATATLVFVAVTALQFLGGIDAAQRGLILYEQTCPLNGRG